MKIFQNLRRFSVITENKRPFLHEARYEFSTKALKESPDAPKTERRAYVFTVVSTEF
jgi:hypothetical protein